MSIRPCELPDLELLIEKIPSLKEETERKIKELSERINRYEILKNVPSKR